jgi:hypothetical protein
MRRIMGVSLVFVAILFLGTVSGASAQTVTTSADPSLRAVFASRSMPQAFDIRLAAITCGNYCDTSIQETSATISGSGSSCTTAQSSLTSQLQSIARGQCQNYYGDISYCMLSVNTTVACTLIAPGTYQVQGYATYSCKDTTC